MYIERHTQLIFINSETGIGNILMNKNGWLRGIDLKQTAHQSGACTTEQGPCPDQNPRKRALLFL